MAEKILKTRIQLKYDTYANWIKNDPVLKTGEVAIAAIPDGTSVAQNEPNVMMKVGDGTSKFSALKWVTGLAGDVHTWAKAATKPTYSASEIDGLDTAIGKIDTNTKYQVVQLGDNGFKLQSQEKGQSEWADVGTITIAKYDDTEVKASIQALETLVGGTAVATQISNAIEALDVADTAVETQLVSAVSEANGKIKVERRALVEGDIPAISQGKVTGLTGALAAKQDKLTFETAYNAENNKAATMTDVKNAVSGLAGAMHFKGVVEELPTATDYNAGDVIIHGNKEYVLVESGKTKRWEEFGDSSSYVVKGSIKDADIASDANIAQSKIAGLTGALGAKADKTALEEVKTSLGTYIKKAEAPGYDDILTKTSAATAYVKQVPGKQLSTNDYSAADKAKVDGLKALASKDKVAKTDLDTALADEINQHGTDIVDLKAHALRDDMTLVFDCGSSTL